MKIWHIQMHLPHGRNGQKIDSVAMLKENPPIIGTGEWDDFQCENFKNFNADGVQKGDLVLVRRGKKPIALCTPIDGRAFESTEFTEKYLNKLFRRVKVLEFYKGKEDFPQNQGTLQNLTNPHTDSYQFIQDWYKQYLSQQKMKELFQTLCFKKQIILQGPPGTGKTYTAQELAYQTIFNRPISEDSEQRKKDLKELGKSEYFELVQFHPSYTYEDFVRGISVETIDGQISYKTKNRVFGELIEKANKNYEKSRKNTAELQQENLLEEDLQSFIDHVTDELEKNGKYKISDKAYIESLDEEAFLYTGEVWSHKFRFPFSELVRMEEADVKERKDLKDRAIFPGKVVQHATYFFNVLSKFRDFRKLQNAVVPSKEDRPETVEEKKYVLIIDEVNRANLPSVLGELIYALEYRDVPVDGMYEYNGTRSFTIPENLYIIGTMNTADRSVGHIDYAIRRRFAFIDVLPKEEVITNKEAKDLFKKVEGLFLNGTLASDFKRKDVQLGHSYFLAETKEELAHKFQYEILPILNEYVNDGILLKKAEDTIKELEQDVLR